MTSDDTKLDSRRGQHVAWRPVDDGATIGQRGSENGVVILDEEHELGARITLERECRSIPFAITCGIYGWMFHTKYLGADEDGLAEVERMKAGLDRIIDMIPTKDDPDGDEKCARVCDAIEAFVNEHR
jgi:hypothetical protein